MIQTMGVVRDQVINRELIHDGLDGVLRHLVQQHLLQLQVRLRLEGQWVPVLECRAVQQREGRPLERRAVQQ